MIYYSPFALPDLPASSNNYQYGPVKDDQYYIFPFPNPNIVSTLALNKKRDGIARLYISANYVSPDPN